MIRIAISNCLLKALHLTNGVGKYFEFSYNIKFEEFMS